MSQEKQTGGVIIAVMITAVVTFLATALLTGGGVYFWQKYKCGKQATLLRKEMNDLNEKCASQIRDTASQGCSISESDQAGSYAEQPSDQAAGEGYLPPTTTEKTMGFIKKVYEKNGKNYLTIDYIQWFMGTEAEKAMREDGECPKVGECLVLDDYYIRNKNLQLRTFEISPDVQIAMQTYNLEKTGNIQSQKISFAQFSQIFNTNAMPHLKNVPYHVEIGNSKILKITEQYVP